MSKHLPDGTIVLDTPEDIAAYRLLTLRSALGLEIQGIRFSSRRSVYQIIKKEFHLRGTKQRVYDQFTQLLITRKILITEQ